MTDEELKRRLSDLEDGWTERKLQSVGGDDVRKALVAFANSLPDGEEALLSIGVANDGTRSALTIRTICKRTSEGGLIGAIPLFVIRQE